jgi:hypothetical protein
MQRDDYDDQLPVSRGQWRAIAEAFLDQAGEPHPDSRLAATILIARLASHPTDPSASGSDR